MLFNPQEILTGVILLSLVAIQTKAALMVRSCLGGVRHAVVDKIAPVEPGFCALVQLQQIVTDPSHRQVV